MKFTLSVRTATGLLGFALTVFMPLTAIAQEFSTEYPMIGAGARTRPAYDGSSSQRVEPVPVIRYYGHPLFARSTRGVLEGGARVEVAPGLAFGGQVTYEPGRNPEESGFLKRNNVAGINPGAGVGLHLEWDTKLGPVPLDLLGRVRQRIDFDQGMQADLRITAGIYRKDRVAVGVFTQATWANAKSAGTFYGITPQQSAVTGLPAYEAGSGLLYTSVGLLWSFDLIPGWVAVGNLEARHLHGDAARSPLTERTSNYYVAAGVAYKF